MAGNDMNHTKIEELHAAITEGNKEKVVSVLEEILVALQNRDVELAVVLIHPPVITELHTRLVDVFAVPRRAMMLRNRVPGRDRRAMLFTQAMLNGMKRVM